MAKQSSYSGMLGDLSRLVAALTANAAELPHLEGVRARLEKTLAEAQEVAKQQAALAASKQEASKQLRRLIGEGNRVAALMRVGIKEHYGPREEKVAEFGLQPFRGRKVKTSPAKPDPQASTPEQPETPTVPAPSNPKP